MYSTEIFLNTATIRGKLEHGVLNKLKHFKAAYFPRYLGKIVRLFSVLLFVVCIIIFFCLESPCYCTFLYIMNS